MLNPTEGEASVISNSGLIFLTLALGWMKLAWWTNLHLLPPLPGLCYFTVAFLQVFFLFWYWGLNLGGAFITSLELFIFETGSH